MTESAFKKLVHAAENGESRQYPHVDEAFLWASGEIERLRKKLDAAEDEIKKAGIDYITLFGETQSALERLDVAETALRDAREQKPYYHLNDGIGLIPLYKRPVPAMPVQDDKCPKELSKSEIDVLGRPNFACVNIARYLITKGIYKKPEKLRAESEQAITIDFLIGFLKKYGDDWSKEADKYLESLDSPQSEVKPS